MPPSAALPLREHPGPDCFLLPGAEVSLLTANCTGSDAVCF